MIPVEAHEPIRVMIVDDDARARCALASLLETYPQIEVVAEAADGVEAVDLASSLRLHVVVMDGIMPHLDGLGAASEIKHRTPWVSVLLLSLYGDLEWQAKKMGADAFLVKSASADEIVDCITRLGRPAHTAAATPNPRQGVRP